MPLGPGVRYRVKHTPHGNVRLAFRGDHVVEATKMKKKSHYSPGNGTGSDMDHFTPCEAEEYAGDTFTDGSVGGSIIPPRMRRL